MKKLFYTLPVFIFLISLFASCNKNENSVPTGGSGTGSVTQTYSSNPNKPIAPNDWTNDSLNANLSFGVNAQNVSDIKLNLSSLEGVTVSNLRFALVHKGIEVFVIDTPLIVSGSGNMTGTVLSDSGTVSINNGNYPFTGKFRPQIPLSNFINSDPSGYWTLKIYNSGNFRTGVIKSWSITITYSPSIQLPVLDSRYLPMIGDTRKFKMYDTNNVNPGPSGENATWDFTYLIENPFEYTEEFVEPIISPVFWRFSQSNIAIRNIDLYQNMLTFLNVNPNSSTFLYYGEGDSLPGVRRYRQYNNPIPLYKGTTFSYNYNASDIGRTISENYLNNGVISSGNYQDSVSGDAWGTLKLPGITYNNVLREKLIINTQDSVNGNQIYYTQMKIFNWYQIGYKFPVFKIQYYLQFNYASGHKGWKLVERTTQNVPISK
jgi:hypothetical protein